jgi:hypothetical protein
MGRIIDHPVVTYLIVGAFSLLVAVVTFQLAGSFAEITRQQNSGLGVGVKIGGPIAGFVISFWLGQRMIERFGQRVEQPIKVRLYLVGTPVAFARDDHYTCVYEVVDPDTDRRQKVEASARWEAGFLTIDATAGRADLLAVSVQDGEGKRWKCDFFPARVKTVEVACATVP